MYIYTIHYSSFSCQNRIVLLHFSTQNHWVTCHATPSAGEVTDIPTRACRRGKHNSSGSRPECRRGRIDPMIEMRLFEMGIIRKNNEILTWFIKHEIFWPSYFQAKPNEAMEHAVAVYLSYEGFVKLMTNESINVARFTQTLALKYR